MPLSSTLNTGYKPSSVNVTQKYTPLNGIQVAGGDTNVVQAMVQNRITTLANLGVRVNRLTYLSIETIDQFALNEAGKNPPLVVVSSNRAGWIKARNDEAVTILRNINPDLQYFDSVMDTRALRKGAVPFYLPIRLGAADATTRNVYIFVASDEYEQYRRQVFGPGVYVVGWRTDGDERLSGFGASRYAALEFFKYINRRNGACNRIWMLDDNVAYIRSLPGLAAVEGQLGAGFGLGFKGGTQVHSDAEFINISKNAQPGPVAATAHIQAPILQQAGLWNVAQFNASGFSFSPYFFTSAEDTSLTTFLGLARCQYYSGCEVFKGLTEPDNTIGSKALQGSKLQLLNYSYRGRNTVPFTCDAVEGATNLGQVIEAARDAQTSPPKITDIAGEEAVSQTYSKALEQILSEALKKNVALPAGVFTIGLPQITSKLTRA